MKKQMLTILALCCLSIAAEAQHAETVARLKQHAFTLADDSLRGRKTGTVYAQKAANYIRRQLQAMGVRPYTDSTYDYPFTYKSGTQKGMNLLVCFPGTDSLLKNEYIVIGAHYDHIGVNMDPSAADNIYNGADDNASGSSVQPSTMASAPSSRTRRSTIS